MKFCKYAVIVLIAGALVFAVSRAGALEKDLVAGLKVTEAKPGELHIQGTDMNSAKYVSAIKEARSGGEINILVEDSLVSIHGARDGQSGTFNYTLKVPAGVDTVTFGKSKTVIWKRTP